MFGPPCHKCGSEENWLPGKDGEQCSCGWPDKMNKPQSFGDSKLGESLGFAAAIFATLAGLALCLYALLH
jgi:hypothetical protein